MARRSPFEPDPEFEYPLAYRLAQFLLGSSEQLGQYTQGLWAQSKGASDVLESMERQDIARDELGRRTQADLFATKDRAAAIEERRREADLKAAEHAAAAQERAAKAATDAARRAGLLKVLGRSGMVTEEQAPPPEFAQDPERLEPRAGPQLFRDLVKRPKSREEFFQDFTPAEAGHPEVVEAYTKLYPTPKEPELKGFATTEDIYRGPELIRPGTPTVKEPPAPSSERTAQLAAQALAKQQRGEPLTQEDTQALATYNLKKQTETELAGVRGGVSLENALTTMEARDVFQRRQKADLAEGTLKPVDAILTRLEAVTPKVLTPGFLGRVAGVTTRRGAEALQSDPNITELAALGQSYVSVIAKIVQGQSGVLSDQDIKRAEQSIPQVGDNLEAGTRKLEILRDIVDTAKQNITRLRGGSALTTPSAPTTAPPGFRPR